MAKTSDGFKISEYDLELRGPGDFFGNRQHGLPRFRQAGMLDDVILLKKSREIAERILEEDPNLEKEDNAKLKYNVESIMQNTNM
jgi:ATP-dependent DNA helicase RecG